MIFSTDIQPSKIGVQLVDADETSQQRIRDALRTTDIATLIGCSSGVDETFGDIASNPPHLLLLDLMLPDRGAPRIVKQLCKQHPHIGVVVLTLHDEKQCLLEYLSLGARGFLLKPVDRDALVTALQEVHRGGRFVDPLLPHCLVSQYVESPQPPKPADPSKADILTVREREVCRYLASGYTNAEVADALRISKRTVETHRAAIMSKVGVKSRAQLVHFAIEHGLWPGADPSLSI